MMRIRLLLSVLALGTSAGLCAPVDFAGSSAPLTITQNTQIPGDTLKPGDYSITVVDSLSDRMIVRVDSRTSDRHALFLAVPAKTPGGDGPIVWSTGLNKTQTLRGFGFGSGRDIEFVYPKAEAVGIAKGNSAKVIAVDPESEGHSATLKKLSKDELQMVNLWMLSLTTTGVDNKTPAVLAQRFNGNGNDAPVDWTVASRTSHTVPIQMARVEQPPIATPSQGVVPAARPVRHTPVVATLPHTGSNLPWVWLAGVLALLGGVGIRTGRVLTARRALA